MEEFTTIALSLPCAVQIDHFGSAAFRVRGKIFAQLSKDGRRGLVKLHPDQKEWVLAVHPESCAADPAWGRHGWTWVVWRDLPSAVVRRLLIHSWRLVAPRALHSALAEAGAALIAPSDEEEGHGPGS